MAQSTSNYSPRDILRLIFRRKHVFWAAVMLFAVAVLVGGHYWPLRYTGTTKFQRRSDAAAGQMLKGASESFETMKLTLLHELVGRDAVGRVVDEVGLTRGLPRDSTGQLTRYGQMAKDVIVRDLGSNIDVVWEVRSENLDLIAVSVTHSDPKLAQIIPDTLVKNYISRVSEQIIRRLTDSLSFLQNQVDDGKTRLAEATNRKVQFEAEHAGMMPESPGTLQDRIQQINADLETLRRQQNAAKQTLARLQGTAQATTGPAAEPSQVIRGPNPELKRLNLQLQEAKDTLDSAVSLYGMTEQHPKVITLRRKIAQLEQRIAETPAETILRSVYDTGADKYNAEVAATISEIEIASREIERLEKRLEGLQGHLANFAPVRQEYLAIVDRVEKQQWELDQWDKRQSEVQMALAAEAAKRRTHLDTVQSAREQFRPSSPKLWMLVAFAVLGGLAFGAGLVLLINAMDRSVATSEEAAEHFGLKIHGVIGEIITPAQKIQHRLKVWTLGPLISGLIVLALVMSLFSIVLKLRYPDKYAGWKASPTAFVFRGVASWVKGE